MFAEKAASLESTSALAMAEVGQQCLLRGKIKEAQRYYKVLINNKLKIIKESKKYFFSIIEIINHVSLNL